MRPGWTSAPIIRDAHDEVRVLAVTLRFPEGALSGGEVRLERRYRGVSSGQTSVPIAPGEPDLLPAPFWAWLEACLKTSGEVVGEVTFTAFEPERPAPAPPVAEPGITLR